MMASKYSLIYRSLAVLLVLVIAQIYVLASPGAVMFGRLVTSSNAYVSVNGSAATSGTTILSATQLRTAEDVGASVQLDSLGKLDVSPGSNLTLNFSEGNVEVNLVSGHAVLKTYQGVNGAITYNGKTERTDSSKAVSMVTGGVPPQQSNSWDKKGWVTFGVGVGGGIALLIYLLNRGDNESPSQP